MSQITGPSHLFPNGAHFFINSVDPIHRALYRSQFGKNNCTHTGPFVGECKLLLEMISEDNEACLPPLKLSMHKRNTQGSLGWSETACWALGLGPSAFLPIDSKERTLRVRHMLVPLPVGDRTVPWRKTFLAAWAANTWPNKQYGRLLGKRGSTCFKPPSCVFTALCHLVCEYLMLKQTLFVPVLGIELRASCLMIDKLSAYIPQAA